MKQKIKVYIVVRSWTDLETHYQEYCECFPTKESACEYALEAANLSTDKIKVLEKELEVDIQEPSLQHIFDHCIDPGFCKPIEIPTAEQAKQKDCLTCPFYKCSYIGESPCAHCNGRPSRTETSQINAITYENLSQLKTPLS